MQQNNVLSGSARLDLLRCSLQRKSPKRPTRPQPKRSGWRRSSPLELGPEGGFRGPRSQLERRYLSQLPADASARVLRRSESERTFDLRSRFEADANAVDAGVVAYERPSDRIGRDYTPSAHALALGSVEELSRALEQPQPLHKRAARRGLAQSASASAQPLALVDGWAKGKQSQGRGQEQRRGKSKRGPAAVDLPPAAPFVGADDTLEALSKLQSRAQARLRRGGRRNVTVPPSQPPVDVMHAQAQDRSAADASSFQPHQWNPAPADPVDPPPSAPASDADAGAIDMDAGARGGVSSLAIEEQRQQQSMRAFEEAAEAYLAEGAMNAAGVRSALVGASQRTLEGILRRVSLPQNARPDAAREQMLGLPANWRDESLTFMVGEVEQEFLRAVADAMVHYNLRSARGAARLGIDRDHLLATSQWWTPGEYTAFEWRVARQTGVDTDQVALAHRTLSEQLCTVEPALLGLQRLYCTTDAGANAVSDDIQDAGMLTGPGTQATGALTWGNVCDWQLTLVGTPEFRNRLPLSFDGFIAEAEARCACVREALQEHWSNAAANELSVQLMQRRNEAARLEASQAGADDTEPLDFIHEQQKELRESGGGGRVGAILDTAAVLMSRQLRGLAENSIDTFVRFVERFDCDHASGDSAFLLQLAVEDDAGAEPPAADGGTSEEAEAAADSRALRRIHLQPPTSKLLQVLNHVIDTMVGATANFRRVDERVQPPLDSPSTASLAPCAMVVTDEQVLEAKRRIERAITEHISPLEHLLEAFRPFASVLRGQEAHRTAEVLARVQDPDTDLNTRGRLSVLAEEGQRLHRLSKRIRACTPDLSFFPMFGVRTLEAKEQLASRVDALRESLVQAIVGENETEMEELCTEYERIGERLVHEPTDSAELTALQKFSMDAIEELNSLQNRVLDSVVPRVRFLLDQEHRLSRDQSMLFRSTHRWPQRIKEYQQRSWDLQNQRKRELQLVVEDRQQQLLRDFSGIARKIENLMQFGSLAAHDVATACKRIAGIQDGLSAAETECEDILEQEKMLEMDETDNMTRLNELRAELAKIDKLWITAHSFLTESETWLGARLPTIDAEDADMKTDQFRRTVLKIVKTLDKGGPEVADPLRAAKQLQENLTTFIDESVPLMTLLCTPGLRARHWGDMEQITGLELGWTEDACLQQMLDVGLQHHIEAIEETCVSATKEFSLEKALDKMEEEWDGMEFGTKEWRTTGTSILAGVDDIQQILDDQIVKVQAMAGSRYAKAIIKRLKSWEHMLVNLQDIIDECLKVQATWLYLEPIFSSDDIMRQMPKEGELFRKVDRLWRTNMKTTVDEPEVVKVGQRDGIITDMKNANEMLDVINKGLNDYLETKRLFFARFFFLSNDELLEILSETKDPLRVQPHCKKCFDGVQSLDFAENLDIMGMISPEKENVPFAYEQTNFPQVNPMNTGGNVEVWLLQTEKIMQRTVAQKIDDAMADYQTKERLEFAVIWPGQVVLCVNQIEWAKKVESSFVEGCIPAYAEQLQKELLETVQLVRGKLTKLQRKTLSAMVVMDVHNRDTTQQLAKDEVSRKTDFDWLAQLRYYWKDDNESAQTGNPGTTECWMINAMQYYAYEYLGNSGRLVITPLTDRCYRTLMGALHLNLGGAPEGPAGTGKTETTKDLGKAVAIQCVVFNCSDGLDYLAMGKFFKGLASAGAWACFDEFNRIQLEVLSVIAQQILTIQIAKAKNVKEFMFEGTHLPLKKTCCPFITMNPGYAGRAELPDNLKVLFRTVAMMVPDYAMIAEILLYSFGYSSGKEMSTKIVMTYKLCSEQLSFQKHYDYGMRAVIAVLLASGNLKRNEGHLPEDVLVLRSIIEVNLPKFLAPDVPLFEGITSDLFPGVTIDPPDRTNFLAAVDEACAHFRLQATPPFVNKIIQTYDMMVVRHSFMVVGNPYAGKTMCWRVLQRALTELHKTFPNDDRWRATHIAVQNPKSITMGQLYGCFDPVSHEWSDGVLAINYRNCATSSTKGGRGFPLPAKMEAQDRKWMMFDGPVDAIWIENMNTVMDDNKKLCLMSGEIIQMSETMSMIMEPMDLEVASPATVSRNGIIYMEPEYVIGWRPLLHSWLDILMVDEAHDPESQKEGAEQVSHPFQITPKKRETIEFLFEWLVEPCIAFVRRELTEMSPTVDANLINSLINIFESMLEEVYVDADGHVQKELKRGTGRGNEKKNKKKEVKNHDEVIECCFLFSLVWSVGATCNGEGRERFSQFLRAIMENIDCIGEDYPGVKRTLEVRQWERPEFPDGKDTFDWSMEMPKAGLVHDYAYSATDSKWKKWEQTLSKFEIAPGTKFQDIVVPTVYTAQFDYMLDLLLTHDKKVLVCGPTGTGKSCYAEGVLNDKMPENYDSILVTFSAKTTAHMTQDIIDGKLDRRRKGVFGPGPGKKAIIFVDDLNMPEVEEWGAQPPIELLRNFCDKNSTPGGWYDLKEMTWKTVVDCGLLAAMGPPGGGRNPLTPRFLRHFNLICFTEFDDSTLTRIFTTIVNWHFNSHKFDAGVQKLGDNLVAATLHTYRAAMENLLPTPLKSHYTFNLRDFSRVVAGVVAVKPHDAFDSGALLRLWTHEGMRVFGDRLVDDEDRNWFLTHVKTMSAKYFSKKFDTVCAHLNPDGGDEITLSHMRRLLFGDYMLPDVIPENRAVEEIQDINQLGSVMDQYLADFNAMSRKQMNLVMFLFAIEHVSRVARILKMPGGNALLVGVGGSGRQSVSRLAAFICDFEVKQIEISKQYGKTEWRDDVKALLSATGTGQREMVFLFSDTQIKEESFVEDINNMLNSGEVPNLFAYDEKVAIVESTRPHARAVYGKKAADMSIPDVWSFFISRVRERLHIVLAFSPIGDAFRSRLRLFPSLINCCTIDWFTEWPEDALIAVAQRFLNDIKMPNDKVRQAVTDTCQFFHQSVRELNTAFRVEQRRINYVTPTSYLELIQAFRNSLSVKRSEVEAARNRYLKGLEQLGFAEDNVGQMQQELRDLQPTLKQAQQDTDALMAQIEAKMPSVQQKQREVGADAAVAQEEADRVQADKDAVQADLAEALPALNDSIKALNTLKPGDINEVKALKKPPAGVKLVCESVCVMKAIKPARIPDPDDPTRRIMDYWGPSQNMLAEGDFLDSLKAYDKDNIEPKIIDVIRKKYRTNPEFTPEKAAKASKACAGLCKWVCAMDTYDRVAKVVAPKRVALQAAESKLSVTMEALNAKKMELKEVEDELQALQDKFDAATAKKKDLEFQVDLCAKKLDRAKSLIEGLGGEKARWTQFSADLQERYKQLLGDVLISAGVCAYLGPFTSVYRERALSKWVQHCKSAQIPGSEAPTLNNTLGDGVKIRQWNIQGLPTDGFSVDNGITISNSRRWPLCIDPQQQANKWIRNMEADNKLQVIKLTDDSYLRTVENAVQFGYPVLLENVLQELDPSIEPLLLKQTFKQGGVICIRLGDSTIEYSDHFKFYITTKLRNPHYLPEVAVKVTLLNFMITPEGLEDQLLGMVVREERADLEQAKAELIVQSAENKRKLKECEDNILQILSGEGNILEDESAIEALNSSKDISDGIKVAQAEADKTEAEIDTVRNGYKPVAFNTQVLFFCIAELCNIEPVYQYSLAWFMNLFTMSIRNSNRASDVPRRLANIDEHYKLSLYRNICRSLLEKDKLLFSFLLTVNILTSQGKVDQEEWYFLLTGGVAVGDNPHENPTQWLQEKGWGEVCRLADIKAFTGLRESFDDDNEEWRGIYDHPRPHEAALPGRWNSELSSFQKMLMLRCIRPDKVALAVQNFVVEQMGEVFVKPPSFDLQACYADSSVITPLVFILSPGSDPMNALQKLAGEMQQTFDFISLGQGQGPIAERMIAKGREQGTWVVLQNCHLAPSFMGRMEAIAEDLSPENTHEKFRMWCTSYPSDIFPVSVLQNGVKMTQEPPKGMRANLLGSFNMDPIADPDFYNACQKDADFRRLCFCLCFFHALVQERRQFGPLGWNIPYEFNESDLRISVRQLQMFLDENDDTPFKALRYTVGECNYGGRVTDDKDRRTLHCILERCYCPANMTEAAPLSDSGNYIVPEDGSWDLYKAYCDSLPLVTEPEVFGMHENANITKNQNETTNLFTSILVTQSSSGGGGGSGPSREDTMDLVAADVLSKLKDEFDMEQVLIRYPVKWAESMNTVLSNELVRFNKLIRKVKLSLSDVRKAIKGVVVMSAELEALGNSLFFGRIPAMWKGDSYPSLKPLAGYCADLYARLEFFDNWLQNTPPSVFWISGFFFTQAFLTGASQNFARKYTVPIDQVVFDFAMMPKNEYANKPKDGVYAQGLFIEGAKWSKKLKVLAESDPKVLFVHAPTIWFKPLDRADLDNYPCYECPVYKTSDRRGILSTTGHSTNFVCFIRLPSDKASEHWTLRGVAMLTQLDD